MSVLATTDEVADDQLLLDLLNSTPRADGVPTDALDDRAASRAWQMAHGGRGTPAELARVRAARDVLQGVVRDLESPSSLAPFTEKVHYRPVATDDGLAWTLDVAADEALAVRAILAWDRLRQTAPGRLRPCANDECSLFLLDRSKANTARWCSMAVCGNRMKARRHYQRRRELQD
ncbi:MAG TPA: CGNR zinc finger domain-containing protein [Nocardioides sp.]|uniref:CGNR zinc finger domain-containing protein n=1 Tax=Nocardioides sp. TaxID=35761 RepID=UPI002F41F575